jgi:hypothetical protein
MREVGPRGGAETILKVVSVPEYDLDGCFAFLSFSHTGDWSDLTNPIAHLTFELRPELSSSRFRQQSKANLPFFFFFDA